MTLVLLAAAGISIGVSAYAGEPFTDTFIILFVVFVNAVLGVYQESKAEKAIDALKKLSQSTAKVFRDGAIKSVNTNELVVGDIISFESGDAIPADARIIESSSLKIEESALTGESVPVEKISEKIEVNNRTITGFNLLNNETLKLLQVISNGKYLINGFTNKSIRKEIFYESDSKYIINKTTRLLYKLKCHGIIKKVARKNKYYLTTNGRNLISSILVFTNRQLLN